MSRKNIIYQVLRLLLILAIFLGVYIPALAQKTEPVAESLQLTPVGESNVTSRAAPVRGRGKISSDFKNLATPGEDGERSIYIVRLEDPPVASYKGGISGLRPTSPIVTGATKLDMNSPESVAYADFLRKARENFINAINQAVGRDVNVVYEYYAALNGLAVELTQPEALIVADLPNVSFIEPDKEFQLETNAGPNWINADAIWAGVGGMDGTFGEGVIVGVIDTGINPDHPSFADIGGDGYDHTNPFGAGSYVGVCDPGDPSYDPTFPCNDKLIGAWGYPTVNSGNPVDLDGHGSHTASTAAGNFVFGATVNTPNGYVVTVDISGVAPHANVIAYAACCTGSALLAARDQVVIDGVDVVNYSIGSSSPTPDPWSSSFALQWLAVLDAGIFVATSAGNNGNSFATLGSPGDLPWLTTIGANTHDLAYINSLINMSGGDTPPPADIDGRGVTVGYGPAPIVYAGDFGDALCLNPFPAGTFSGEIVVCDRGIIARVDKGTNVSAGGAGGLVLAEVTPGGIGALVPDTHVIPAVHINDADGDALKAWLASGSGHMATISGTILDQNVANADIMAKFSSRGMNRALPDIIKPDVTAPGIGIMAAYRDGVEYNIINGASMSSPHVAGAGALLKALYPDWTPAEIQSALMSTADTNVVDEDGLTPADPFAMGAGRVDLANAALAGLLLNETTAGFQAANPADGGDPSTLNLASMGQDECVGNCSWTRTVENVLSSSGNWSAATTAETGMSLSVSPTSFTLDPGETQEIVVTANLSGVPEGEWRFGRVSLSENGALAPDAHFSVAAAFSPGSLPDSVEILTRRNAGSQLSTGLQTIAITDLTLSIHGLAKGNINEERLISDPTNGNPYDGGFDPLVDGTYFINIAVPAGTKSLIAETIFSESSDLDLFVGSGDTPTPASKLCSSTSPSAIQYCELADPAPGTYWVLVQNWSPENGPTLPGQLSTLVTAVVPKADSGNMSVEGPTSVPAAEPFDVRIFWNTPTMAAGDRWYGSFDLGSSPGNPGDIGNIPVLIQRLEDDVTKTVDPVTASAGDTLSYEIVVQPNVTPEDLTYTIVDTIPVGLTYKPGTATATSGVVTVVGGTLTWTGVLPKPSPTYDVQTSNTDPACAAPLADFDGVPDAYVNLEAFGILANPGISGDTVWYSVDFSGGEFDFFGSPQGEIINFTDDGFAFFNPSSPGGAPWVHWPIPTADDPNNLMAVFWRDMEIVYDGPSNRGVSMANLTSGGVPVAGIIEYDDVEDWPAGGNPTYDFELIAYYEPDPSRYEYIFAFDNLTGPVTIGTIGLENMDGSFGVQYSFNDITVTDGMAVCFDLVGVAEPVVITYQVTVDDSAHGILNNNVVHNTDNPGSMEASTTTDVEILNIPPDCSAASPSIDFTWPPNHKFVPVDVIGVTDWNGDTITMTIDSIFQDESVDVADDDEDGNTFPDGQGVGTSTAEVRAERYGLGNGRYYHIFFTADDGYGGTCSGEVLVGVPVSKGVGGAPVDDGTLFDSTISP